MPPKEEDFFLKNSETAALSGLDGGNVFQSLFRRQTSSTVTSTSLPSSSSSSSSDDNSCMYKRGETVVSYTDDGAPYVICNSSKPFVNPTSLSTVKEYKETISNNSNNNSNKGGGRNLSYQEYVNSTLNLNLGLPSFFKCRSQLSPMTIRILEFLDALLLSWCEPFFFYFWSKIMPISLKRKINRIGWKLFCKVHTILLGKSTGVHPTTSVEYHALTTAMWFAQYFVITPRRIRFSLGEQHTISARGMPQKDQVEIINVDMRMTNASVGSSSDPSSQFISENEIPESQQDHCHVRGIYIHCGANCKNVNTDQQHRKIIFWIYGGAYLGGDVLSNASVGNEFGQDCQVDVFIPEFRLAPESTIDDVLWDVCLAYLWVLRRAQYDGSNVCVLGLSSGGALALRLLQLIAERHQYQPPEDLTPSFLAPIVDKMAPKCAPKCAVFLGPYIDYTMPKKGSFLHYSKHDLVVTEAVQHYCLPYLNDFIPPLGDDLNGSNSIRGGGGGESKNTNQPHNSTGRKIYSPVHRSFRGMSPTSLCFVVSEHEVTFDMTIEAANKAREEGCDVTVGVWKYMCHVWPCLQSMIPEGKIAMDFTKRYINLHMTK